MPIFSKPFVHNLIANYDLFPNKNLVMPEKKSYKCELHQGYIQIKCKISIKYTNKHIQQIHKQNTAENLLNTPRTLTIGLLHCLCIFQYITVFTIK